MLIISRESEMPQGRREMAATAPTRIAQIAIAVRDAERAKAFYRDTLGLEWIADAPPGLSFFRCGEVRLMLSRPEGPETAANSILYYAVEDAAAAHDGPVRQGVVFGQPRRPRARRHPDPLLCRRGRRRGA